VIVRAPSEPLSDGKVVVRLPHDRDVEALVRYGDDPDVAETIWVPIPTPCPRDVAAGRLAEFRNGWEQEQRFGPALIIVTADTNEMIGVIFLRVRENESVELTYGVAPAFRNRGIATASGRARERLVSRGTRGVEGRAADQPEQQEHLLALGRGELADRLERCG
jgi:RimJ/RimL family protein N-acetyltransferase